MLRWDEFEVLTFDCYGTLIDWETGLRTALAAVFAAHGVRADLESALEVFAGLEAAAEQGEYRPYKSILQAVLAGLGARLGFSPTADELQRFSASVKDWPAFPDSAPALQALHRTYRLAIVSNIDDDLFAFSAARLGVPFDWVITAQQVRSYKPSLRNFEEAFSRIAVPKNRILHVAQSLFHDIAPANRLGLPTVWVNRRKGQEGFGATPAAEARPTLEVPDLRTLAELAAPVE
jgi:2-haloacid dehalogenase